MRREGLGRGEGGREGGGEGCECCVWIYIMLCSCDCHQIGLIVSVSGCKLVCSCTYKFADFTV